MLRTVLRTRTGRLFLTVSIASLTVVPTQASAETLARCATTPVAAHRGFTAVADENTVQSFVDAAKRHAEYAEGDVQITKDYKFVLMHDDTLDRTTDGSGQVEDHTLAELKQLRTARGYQIPTLTEVLKAVAPYNMRVRLETKPSPLWSDTMWQAYIAVLRRTGMDTRTLLNDASRTRLAVLDRFAPDIENSWKTPGDRSVTVSDVPDYIDGIVPRLADMTPEDVVEYHAAGLRVHAPLANRPAGWQRAIENGADTLMTDALGRYNRWCSTQVA